VPSGKTSGFAGKPSKAGMTEKTVIRVEDVTVRFNMASEKIDSIKEYFVKLVKRQWRFQQFLALKHITR
jgi:hypothetical protein